MLYDIKIELKLREKEQGVCFYLPKIWSSTKSFELDKQENELCGLLYKGQNSRYIDICFAKFFFSFFDSFDRFWDLLLGVQWSFHYL